MFSMSANNKKRTFFIFSLYVAHFLIILPLFSQAYSSQSMVNWEDKSFTSRIELNFLKAGLSHPVDRGTAVDSMHSRLPELIKDPLLSIIVDSSRSLGDLVLFDELKLEVLTDMSKKSKKTPGTFINNGKDMEIFQSINLQTIASLLIKHKTSYTQQIPIQQVSSKPYTGILIDARGLLPVQGEFVSEKLQPSLFPKIWTDTMDLFYEKNMVEPTIAINRGLVSYTDRINEKEFASRIGIDPLRIKAQKVFGVYRTDPVIAEEDALKILSIPQNLELLKNGKIIILVDSELLLHAVSAPEKTSSYYAVFKEFLELSYDKRFPDKIQDTPHKGIQITSHFNFVADSPALLANEKEHLDSIAQVLEAHALSNEYTIEIEGHTASVGKPEGEMILSIERAETILAEFEKRGIDTREFRYRGFGGTLPIGDNETEEGRAENRRVEIYIVPKASYIQRAN